jgi:predicted oxidoreductase
MQTFRIPNTDLTVSRLAYGCMNLGGRWERTPATGDERAHAARLVHAAVEHGITLFDHADIYTFGKSEELFGAALAQAPGLRERIVLQSKCGIRFAGDPEPGAAQRYDFSHDHIVHSVEGSLRRLQTDRLDVLLLHRPDALVEPEAVARAFDELYAAGKVRYFGVSNHTGAQIALLQRFVAQPLVVNQVELNLLHAGLIEDGMVANNREDGARAGVSGTLDYCRLHEIVIQAWSPVAGGRLIDPPADAPPRVRAAAELVARLAAERGTTREAIALAWLLRHPARVQPVIGTTNLERLAAGCRADDVTLSREEWYALLIAARGEPLP